MTGDRTTLADLIRRREELISAGADPATLRMPIDPDPLDVTPWDQMREAALEDAAWDRGFAAGVESRRLTIAFGLVAVFVAGLVLGGYLATTLA